MDEKSVQKDKSMPLTQCFASSTAASVRENGARVSGGSRSLRASQFWLLVRGLIHLFHQNIRHLLYAKHQASLRASQFWQPGQ